MSDVLLITDDTARGERLARDLRAFRACHVHDLYGDASPTHASAMIITDVSALTSESISRLLRVLATLGNDGRTHLFLVYGNAVRSEAQARILGATGTLPAGTAAQTMLSTLEVLHRQAHPADSHAGAALRFLADIFVPDRPLTPAVIDTGTELIARAIREVGVRDWIRVVRRFDDATHQHCLLVAGLAAAFAQGLGLAASDGHRLTKAALLHDVGKIFVPTDILNKPARLTDAEMRVMRTHPDRGHAVLMGHGFEDEMLAVVRSHHEMLDGSGYPDGLKGIQIPDLVRLVSICDIYAALIERRPYRSPMPGVQAFEIVDGMIGRLDGDMVRAFHPIATASDQAFTKAA